jgi:hypothetical protein
MIYDHYGFQQRLQNLSPSRVHEDREGVIAICVSLASISLARWLVPRRA